VKPCVWHGQAHRPAPLLCSRLAPSRRYLIVPNQTLASGALLDGLRLPTALPGAPPLVVQRTGDAIAVRGGGGAATLLRVDIPTCHGIMHVLDRVLLPDGV
jgi:hypothetical protein